MYRYLVLEMLKVAASRKAGCQRNLKNALIRVGQQMLSHAHPVEIR